MSHFAHDTYDLAYLLGVGDREFAALNEQAVFQAHAHVTAHQRGLSQERHLVPARRQNRPLKSVAAEEPIRSLLHEHEIVEIGPDTAPDTEYHLHKKAGLHQTTIETMAQVV